MDTVNLNNKNKDKGTDEKKKDRQNKIVKVSLDVTICILLLVFVFCGYQVVVWFMENHNSAHIVDQIGRPSGGNLNLESKIPVISGSDSDTPLISDPPAPITPPWVSIGSNIKELKKLNGDTIAWIKGLGLDKESQLNYPVVQTTDNDFYISHDYNKKSTNAGWVFADYRNTEQAKSLNFIIYGHARADGSMLGSLKQMRNEKWYSNQNNHFIYIITEDDQLLYQIFSIYYTPVDRDDGFSYIKTNFNSKSEYHNFLKKIINLNEIPEVNYSAHPSDSILTLSTCKGADDTNRLVVHAKLVGSKNDPLLESYRENYNSLPD